MNNFEDKFFELIQISTGKKKGFKELPSNEEWSMLFDMSMKQSMAGLLFEGLKVQLATSKDNKPSVFFEWLAIAQQAETISKYHLEKTKRLYEWFKHKGYDCCVLKGLGVARLYPQPDVRQAGDIDIWIGGNGNVSFLREQAVQMMREIGVKVTCVDYVNCHAGFYNDIEVEVHFRPTYLFNPLANRKVQRWICKSKQRQMAHYDSTVGFAYPTITFNLVFSLIHIYRHVFSEGIGLRQLTDYYFILIHSSIEERNKAIELLKSFGLRKFTATVMYIMSQVFDIDKDLLLCEPNAAEGEYLLSEILRGGNFGQFDDRNKKLPAESRMRKAAENVKRNLRFLKHYPNEVVWIPAWKTWHYFWRISKGYLD